MDLNSKLSSFKDKRILITGDTGFKGSWLALWLNQLGAKVYGYALAPEGINSHFNLLKLDQLIEHRDGNICDLKKMQEYFDLCKPEFVFHLAAQALVRKSYLDPKETFETNVLGSVNLLECVRNSKTVKSLVYVTSDKSYKNKEWIWGYRENDELGGHDPYSASKAAAEIVFSSYKDSFFKENQTCGIGSVRAGNVIGGGDWSIDRIVPDCISALVNGKPIILRKPNSTRPWQHVLEPLSGYLLLAHYLAEDPKKFSGSWNFGPRIESTKTVLDLTKSLVSEWGDGKIEVKANPEDPHEAGLLSLNCDKAEQLLYWRPRWNFNQTVAETVFWYSEINKGKDALKLSNDTIKKYMETQE